MLNLFDPLAYLMFAQPSLQCVDIICEDMWLQHSFPLFQPWWYVCVSRFQGLEPRNLLFEGLLPLWQLFSHLQFFKIKCEQTQSNTLDNNPSLSTWHGHNKISRKTKWLQGQYEQERSATNIFMNIHIFHIYYIFLFTIPHLYPHNIILMIYV